AHIGCEVVVKNIVGSGNENDWDTFGACCGVEVLASRDDGIHVLAGEGVTWAGPGVGHIDVNDGWAGSVTDATLETTIFVELGACFEDFLQDRFHFLFEGLVLFVSHFNLLCSVTRNTYLLYLPYSC